MVRPSGKRRCQAGHHLNSMAVVDGVKGEVCKRCSTFTLMIEPRAFTRRDVARWLGVPSRMLRTRARST